MKKLFAVIRSRGAAWQTSRALEEQPDWDAHAAFMTALEQEGFVVLGGPLQGTPNVLLIIRAQDQAEIADRLGADPWSTQDLLRLSQVSEWNLRLGHLSS